VALAPSALAAQAAKAGGGSSGAGGGTVVIALEPPPASSEGAAAGAPSAAPSPAPAAAPLLLPLPGGRSHAPTAAAEGRPLPVRAASATDYPVPIMKLMGGRSLSFVELTSAPLSLTLDGSDSRENPDGSDPILWYDW
jgi:hypothetical protein